MLQPRSKGDFIYIRLDETGSNTWLLIDGHSRVMDICQRLTEHFPGTLSPADEIEERVTQFMTFLYHQRYITFREIQ